MCLATSSVLVGETKVNLFTVGNNDLSQASPSASLWRPKEDGSRESEDRRKTEDRSRESWSQKTGVRKPESGVGRPESGVGRPEKEEGRVKPTYLRRVLAMF